MISPLAIDYLPILLLFALAFGFVVAILTASLLVGAHKPDGNKNAPYECGFDPFERARDRFDVRYALVAVLFIVFDLEVAFLFPWAMMVASMSALGFWAMMGFLFILTIGFIHEWQSGALEWE